MNTAIADKQADLDAAQQLLERRKGNFPDNIQAQLNRLGELQRELADLISQRNLIIPQYQTFRSLFDINLHLICRDGEFEALPGHIRHQGPWQAITGGEVADLKQPEQRSLIEGGGYVVESRKLDVPKHCDAPCLPI